MDKEAERPEIFLVGVVHGDPEGYHKVLSLLERFRPHIISVEISEYSRWFRQIQEVHWQRQFQQGLQSLPRQQRNHLAVRKVAAQIAWPCEVKAVEDYAHLHGVAWQAVDINALAREHLPRYSKELLSPENLKNLVLTPDGDWDEYIRQEYRRARRVLQTGRDRVIELVSRSEVTGGSRREKVLAGRVRRLAREWIRVVHVGGWEHLIMSGPFKTMSDYLVALRPQRLLLDDLEAFEGPVRILL